MVNILLYKSPGKLFTESGVHVGAHCRDCRNIPHKYGYSSVVQMKMKKVAFVFSGAAARIAQQAVLMKYLVQGKAFKDGTPVIPSVLAGASSGGLSVVVLNAILLSEGLVEGPALETRFSWTDYEQLLSKLKKKDVYKEGSILRRSLEIVGEDALYDTTPLRKLLTDVVERRFGWHTLGDLPVKSYISVVEQKTGKVHRLCSEENPDLPLVDVLMATSAIPVLFPPVDIRLPDQKEAVLCVDGGTGPDMIPVDAVRNDECDTMILVRPELFDPQKPWNRKLPLAKFRIAENAFTNFMFIEETLMEYAFYRAAAYGQSNVFCYFPNLRYNYYVLDFESGREQMDETTKWADLEENLPRPVKLSSFKKRDISGFLQAAAGNPV